MAARLFPEAFQLVTLILYVTEAAKLSQGPLFFGLLKM